MYSTADVLGMSVVREIISVGGVCEMCMCLARYGVGGEGMRGLGFTKPVGTWRSVGRLSVFGLRWGVCFHQGLKECGCVMSV